MSFPPAGWSEGFTESGEKRIPTWDKPTEASTTSGSGGEQKEQLPPPGEHGDDDNVSFPRMPRVPWYYLWHTYVTPDTSRFGHECARAYIAYKFGHL